MPRTLRFSYRTVEEAPVEIAVVPAKLDRGKLYGTVETEALDEQGRRCELMTLATDGKTLIGKGGKAMGFVSGDGRWLDRARLHPVGPDEQPLPPVPSSFDAPIALDQKTTIDDYLSHNVKSVYLLDGEAAALAPLAAELRAGAIYRFDFSFTGGITADVGFLLAGADDSIFLAVGQKTQLHFLGLDAPPVYEDEPTAAAAESGPGEDDLDFGML